MLLLRANAQHRPKGWVHVWDKNGGKHPHDYTVRLKALRQAEAFMGCCDEDFTGAGEDVWEYLAQSQSLCVSPEYLWDTLASNTT